MSFTEYRINEIGMAEIADFLIANHKEGGRIAEDPTCINAWAAEAEESLENGNPAMIEIRAHDSVPGFPLTFTVSQSGIDAWEIEVD
jgi:hypothetical protein